MDVNYVTMNIPKGFQANIIKPHGRSHAAFLLIYFKTEKINDRLSIERIRGWVKKMGKEYITSHQYQCTNSREFKKNNNTQEFIYTLALSYTGYEKLGISSVFIPEEFAFVVGMHARKEALQDYMGASKIEERYIKSPRIGDKVHSRIDAILMIAHEDKNLIKEEVAKIKIQPEFKDAVFYHFIEYGFNKKATTGIGSTISPLGFSDGHSNKRSASEAFETVALLEKYPSGVPFKSYGSYFVFRKTAVNDTGFKIMVEKLAKETGGDKDFAAALLMGRFKDGTPLILSSKPEKVHVWTRNKKDLPFDYDEDRQGNKCPIHAHIRAVNPRKGGPFPSPIIRRSMNFSPIKPNTEGDKDPNEQYCKSDKRISGLFFMSYQKSIERQFEALLKNMKHNKDAIAYRPNLSPQAVPVTIKFPKQYGKRKRTSSHEIGGNCLTHFRGGEYFFAPSITFLKNIDKFPIATP